MTTMAEWIEIDLNVRTNGSHTWTYVSPDEVLEVGAAYVVGESESRLIFPATLVALREDGYAEFDVAWEKGVIADPPEPVADWVTRGNKDYRPLPTGPNSSSGSMPYGW